MYHSPMICNLISGRDLNCLILNLLESGLLGMYEAF